MNKACQPAGSLITCLRVRFAILDDLLTNILPLLANVKQSIEPCPIFNIPNGIIILFAILFEIMRG